MKFKIGLLLMTLLATACTREQNVGYISLSLPRYDARLQSQAEESGFIEAPAVSRWKITVSADDIQEPIVVDSSDEVVRIPVKPGLARVVHVAGRGESVNGISQGFSGETVTDVAEGAETEAVVDVYRSVTLTDANLPVTRLGGAAPEMAPDVNEVTLTLQANSLLLTVSFNNEVEAPWGQDAENSLRGLVELDLDRNEQTGDASKIQSRHRAIRAATGSTEVDLPIGVDATIDLSPAGDGFVKLLKGDTAVSVTAHFAARMLSVTVPFDQLGGAVSSLRFVALAMDKRGSVDFAPEKDFVQLSLVDEAPPVASLKAVASFDGSFVAAFREGGFAPIPVLRSSPAGLHAAWISETGFDYSFSENGKVFGDRTSVLLPQDSFADIGFESVQNYNIDLAANEKGHPTVVVSQVVYDTEFVDLSPLQNSTAVAVAQADEKGFLPVLESEPKPTSFSRGYLGGQAQVVSTGDTAIVANIAESTMHDSELMTVRGGLLVDSMAPTVSGDEQALAMDGLGNFFFSHSSAVIDTSYIGVNQLTLAGTKPTLTLSKNLGEGLYISGLRSAAASKSLFYSSYLEYDYILNAETLSVWDLTGKAYAIADSGVSSSIYAAVDAIPDIAVSKSGRVGVVWHTETEGLHTIYYSEKMPTATAFSKPVKVGPGVYASIAFDAMEQPVVLVTAMKVVSDPQTESTTIESAELTSYRGE